VNFEEFFRSARMNVQHSHTVQPSDVPFAIYDAFTEKPYSGSQGAVVLSAEGISPQERARIAREIGAPATAFVDEIWDQNIKVQFFSTVMELPMCGHGTICLMTRLVELGLISGHGHERMQATLVLPNGEATVEYCKLSSGRFEVMLDVAAARFAPVDIDLAELLRALGVEQSDLSNKLPVEVAHADFVHLCLPMRDLDAMRLIRPDFAALTKFCNSNGLETVAAFSIDTVDSAHDLHVRDFCPAVGVPESAAAGTTNAALAAYLLRNDSVQLDATGNVLVRAEQGMEIDRPSKISTRIKTDGTQISRLQVGGVASRVFEGVLNVAVEKK
jgi:PhzF family phenazine biosynthesis protein